MSSYDTDELEKARLRMKGEQDVLEKEEDLFTSSDVGMDYQVGQEEDDDIWAELKQLYEDDEGFTDDYWEEMKQLEQASEGGAGSGRKPEGTKSALLPEQTARAQITPHYDPFRATPQSQRLQTDPELSRMTEEAPDDIDPIFDKAEEDSTISVAGPPANTQPPANMFDDEEDEAPIAEAKETMLDPSTTDITICVVCGRDIDDHSNPNTDYRGMNGTAPPTDHYFSGGDLGGSDDKLWFESYATEEFKEEEHPRDKGQFTSKGGGDTGKKEDKHSSMSDKDLVKSIKGGSKDWHDWGRNEKTEDAYAEIERRNREIPKPTSKSGDKVFRDDPDAVAKMEQKVKYWEDQKEYWNKIAKFPNRDYQTPNQLGDAKWFMGSNISTNLRDAKKKLEGIKEQQGRGTQLVRKPTYKGGKKRFYYSEEPKDKAEEPIGGKARIDDDLKSYWQDMGEKGRNNILDRAIGDDVARSEYFKIAKDGNFEDIPEKFRQEIANRTVNIRNASTPEGYVQPKATESEWKVHTISQGTIDVTLGEQAEEIDAMEAVKRMYFEDGGYIDERDILTAVKIGESRATEEQISSDTYYYDYSDYWKKGDAYSRSGLALQAGIPTDWASSDWDDLPADVQAKIRDAGYVTSYETYDKMSWEYLPKDIKQKLGEGLIRTTESEWNTSTQDKRKEILTENDIEVALLTQLLDNELQEEEEGHDETEDIALIAQLLDPEADEGIEQDFKKKLTEFEDSDRPVSPNTLQRYSEPIDLPTGKNALDQTYGVSEPETPDGQDLTGITIGDEEIIEKKFTPPKILFYKQYPFGRRAGKQNPFGEATPKIFQTFNSLQGATEQVSLDTMNKAHIWWDNKFPERPWSDMRIGDRQHAILAFLNDPSTKLSEAKATERDIGWTNKQVTDQAREIMAQEEFGKSLSELNQAQLEWIEDVMTDYGDTLNPADKPSSEAKEFESPLRDEYGNPYPTPEGDADCTFCGKKFDNWDVLGDHITIVHNDQGRTREFYGGNAPQSILNHPDWTGYAGEGGQGSGRKQYKSEDPKSKDKAHIGWKNYGIDDYIDKAEKEYLESEEQLEDPTPWASLAHLAGTTVKDILFPSKEQAGGGAGGAGGAGAGGAGGNGAGAPSGNGGEAPTNGNGNGEPEEEPSRRIGFFGYGRHRNCPKGQVYRNGKCVEESSEGGLGSGKKDHKDWMRAIEEEHTYDFCENCSMITEQVNKKCAMCGKKVE